MKINSRYLSAEFAPLLSVPSFQMKQDKPSDVGFHLLFVELISGILTVLMFISVSKVLILIRVNKKDKRTRKHAGFTTI